MSPPNHPPASLRYLKARLKPFKRPAFWASALGLMLVLLFTWEYWKNPQSLSALRGNSITGSNTPDVKPTLSAEELAAVTADIDNSSVFLEEFNRTKALSLPTPSNQPPQTSTGEGLLPQNLRQLAETDSSPASNSQTLKPQQTFNLGNPFANPTQGFLTPSSIAENTPLTSLSSLNQRSASSTTGSTTNSFFNPNQSTASVSPLQSALEQVAVSNTIRTTNETPVPTNTQRQAAVNPTYPTYQGQATYPATTVPGATGYSVAPRTPTAPSNSYTYLVPSPSTTNLPLAAPVTPVVPTTSNYGQYSTQPPAQVNGVINPGFSSTPGNPGLQSSQLNQPTFTTPNPIPGQYIGGGQINTFSNP